MNNDELNNNKQIEEKNKNEGFRTVTVKEYFFSKPIPYLTALIVVYCIINFMLKSYEGDITNWQQYEKYGFFSYEAIIQGKYYGIITSAFVHGNLMHIFFNLYCIFFFGMKIEKEIGFIKYLFLIITSCIAGAGLELLFSQTTGIGISGVAYALIGFLWVSGQKDIRFINFLKKEDFINAVIWLVFCIIMTYTGNWNIANFAHLGGFIWGILFAYLYILKEKKLLFASLQIIQMIISFLPIFYAPWNETWVKIKLSESFEKNDVSGYEFYIKKLLTKNSEDPYILNVLANSFFEKKDFSNSKDYYKKLLDIMSKQSDNKQLLYFIKGRLADSYISLKIPNEAIKLYEEILLNKEIQNVDYYYYNLACAYSLNKNTNKAIENLKKSIEINENNKKNAVKDIDFDNIKESEYFKSLR